MAATRRVAGNGRFGASITPVPRPTRAAFVDAAYGLRHFDLGGFDVNFSEPGRDASRFIELTMVGRDGRFLR